MRKILVAGNWKMHGSEAMINELLGTVIDNAGACEAADIAVFPPFPYLAQVQSLAAGSPLKWGAQNLNAHTSGAYTGEVGAGMLLEFGCSMVLLGHSERRTLYQETDRQIAEKFTAARNAGLTPVLCIGESLTEREAGATEQVVDRQLDAVLENTGIGGFANAIIAYEPVWAIGTGKTATAGQAQQVHAHIRDKLSALDGTIAGQLRILYGGSVNGSNAAELFAERDIDGGLIGGASLKAEDFLAIYNAAGQ